MGEGNKIQRISGGGAHRQIANKPNIGETRTGRAVKQLTGSGKLPKGKSIHGITGGLGKMFRSVKNVSNPEQKLTESHQKFQKDFSYYAATILESAMKGKSLKVLKPLIRKLQADAALTWEKDFKSEMTGDDFIQAFTQTSKEHATASNSKTFQAEVTLATHAFIESTILGNDDAEEKLSALKETMQELSAFKKFGYDHNDATRVTTFKDSNLKSELEELGSGNFNTVYTATYNVNGTDQVVVLKPEARLDEAESVPTLLSEFNIDEAKPLTPHRNVAAYKLDEAFGAGVTPMADFAVHKGKLYLVLGFAEGTTLDIERQKVPLPQAIKDFVTDPSFRALSESDQQIRLSKMGYLREKGEKIIKITENTETKELEGIRFTGLSNDGGQGLRPGNPEARRQMTWLQLLDHITGQGDSHGGNMMIKHDHQTGDVTVQGIDRDLSFGLQKNAEEVKNAKGSHSKLYPPVIDEEMQAKILNIQSGDLDTIYRGLLPKANIEASKQRLESLQKHVTSKDVIVIDKKTEWGSDKATIALNKQLALKILRHPGAPKDDVITKLKNYLEQGGATQEPDWNHEMIQAGLMSTLKYAEMDQEYSYAAELDRRAWALNQKDEEYRNYAA